MTDESNVEIRDSDAFKRQRSKEEMQKQLISFALMIVFTLIAFALVATESINKMYVVPILLLYAFKREKSRDACYINFWWCMGCVSNISWFSCYQLVVKDWRISSSLLFLFNKYKLMLLL